MLFKKKEKVNTVAKRKEKCMSYSKVVIIDYKLFVVNTLGKYFSVICNIVFGIQ
jgi:hypothetical protein